MAQRTLRTCEKGHQYYKSSDCPVCPTCALEDRPQGGFLSQLSAPARRALEGRGITSVNQLAAYSEKEIMKLHGMGPGSLPKLRGALESAGLSFRK